MPLADATKNENGWCHRVPQAGNMECMWVSKDCEQLASALCVYATARTLRTGHKHTITYSITISSTVITLNGPE